MGLKPVSVIKANLGIEPNGRVEKFFANTCRTYMDKYVPKDTGTLRETAYVDSENCIVYNQPYAYAQYVGFTTGQVKNYTTPGTGPYWDSLMVSAEMQDVVNEVQNYIGGK